MSISARHLARAREAFTLIEVLTVISILALLAAILEPVLIGAKRSALRSSCQSNLRQIGLSFNMYGADWDDRYPWAIDAFTRANTEALEDYPPPTDLIPDLVTVLSVYAGGHGSVWRCPADIKAFQAPIRGQSARKTYPSAFDFAGTSYVFKEQRYFGKSQTSLNEAELRVCEDAGLWHCEYPDPNFFTKTENVLFGDEHVRFASLNDRS